MATPRQRTVIIDDAADIRGLVRAILAEDESFSVIGEASDGEAGLRLVRQLEPDLVLLDISMPRMDGLEVLAVLREELPSIMVVMLTGHSSESPAGRATTTGAAGFLEKNALVYRLLPGLRAILAQRTSAAASEAAQTDGAPAS